MSASRSAVSSQPAESRMKPSGTASPPQRARRSAHVWTLPKLVASVTSRAAREEALRALGAPEVERDDHAVAAHLAPRDLVARVVRQAGVAHALHVVAGGEQPRDRQGVVAAALHAQRERRKRAVREPGLERARERARLAAPVAERLRALGVARGDVAEQQVGVAAHLPSWRS